MNLLKVLCSYNENQWAVSVLRMKTKTQNWPNIDLAQVQIAGNNSLTNGENDLTTCHHQLDRSWHASKYCVNTLTPWCSSGHWLLAARDLWSVLTQEWPLTGCWTLGTQILGRGGVNSEQEWMKSAALGVGGGQCNIWDTGQVCHKWTKLDTWHKG